MDSSATIHSRRTAPGGLSPDVDVSNIKGNVSDEEKRRSLSVFHYFVGNRENSYGADVGQRVKLVEANVWPRLDHVGGSGNHSAYGETIFEVIVERGG